MRSMFYVCDFMLHNFFGINDGAMYSNCTSAYVLQYVLCVASVALHPDNCYFALVSYEGLNVRIYISGVTKCVSKFLTVTKRRF